MVAHAKFFSAPAHETDHPEGAPVTRSSTARRTATALAAGAAALVLAGCGGGSGSSAATTGSVLPPISPSSAPSSSASTTTPTTTSAPASTTTAAPAPTGTAPAGSGGTADGPAGCPAASLSLGLGQSSSGAGTQGIPLVFTNTGSAPCSLAGFPGVSYVAGDAGDQVGAPATRTGPDGGAVVLAPGGVASALVLVSQAGNYPAADCSPTPVRGFRVYPPDDTGALYVASPDTGCANPSVTPLRVQAVAAGASGGL